MRRCQTWMPDPTSANERACREKLPGPVSPCTSPSDYGEEALTEDEEEQRAEET